MSEQEQDPKRWFADGFGGRWEVDGELAAKIHTLNPTLADARLVVMARVNSALNDMEKEFDRDRETELEAIIGTHEEDLKGARAELEKLTAARLTAEAPYA